MAQDQRLELPRPEVPHHPRGDLQRPLHGPHQHLPLSEAARRAYAGRPLRLRGRVPLGAVRRRGAPLLVTYASH